MSADNGVYILKTRKPPIKEDGCYINQDGFEYRVAHCQSIDDIDCSDLFLAIKFGNCRVINIEREARDEAFKLEDEYEYLEYGISTIDRSCDYFPNITAEAARKAIDCYQGAIPLGTDGGIRLVESLDEYIHDLHNKGAVHRKGFALNSLNADDVQDHLNDELEELKDAANYIEQLDEAGDVLGCVLHLFYVLGLPLDRVVEASKKKLDLRFNHVS